jgi:hypothetical protein
MQVPHHHKVRQISNFNNLSLSDHHTNVLLFLVHDFYSSHVHQMANQAAARQSPTESTNHGSSPNQNQIHNSSTSAYYHHYHPTSLSTVNQTQSANYSPPHSINQSNMGTTMELNGNESPNSVDQFTNSSNNNIQLPETPNSLVTTMMGPTSGNSDSNDGTTNLNRNATTEASTITANNTSSGYPWCGSAGAHQFSLSNTTTIPSSTYNTTTHHPSASIYSAHHNLSTLIPHQNISSFAHPHSGKSYGMSQPFYSWY